MAFNPDETPTLKRIVWETTVDFSFMIDMIVVFHSAYYDDQFRFICNKTEIAQNYLKSWFWIDLLACIPLQLLAVSFSANELFKFLRITKLHRMIKITRITRLLKLMSARNKLAGYINNIFKTGFGADKLFFALFIFLLLCHVASCGWIIVALYEEETHSASWLN